MGEPTDLGVLLVHGIGVQRRGDTLLDIADPLAQSLTDWLGDDAVKREDTQLAQAGDGRPAHLRMRIRRGDEVKRVLVAESWWADVFQPPGWWAFAKWLVWGVPFVIFRAADHGISVIDTNEKLDDARSSKKWRDWARVPWYVAVRLLKNVVSVALVVVATVFLLFGGIVALVPRLRIAILSAQRVLIRYLGDSYCLLTSPVCAEATVSQVERDLQWLEHEATEKVAIVAHSQGAELVRSVVARREAAPPIASLITFGAGIAKLRAVRRLHGRKWEALWAYVLRIVAAVITAGGPLLAVRADLSVSITVLVAIAALVVAGLLITRARRILQEIVRADELADDLGVGADKLERWLDFYATSDPVPEGALPLEKLELTVASSTRIANYRSPLRDHTCYAQNGEAFRPAVLAELAGLVDWTFRPPAMVVVHNSRERRERKTLALVSDRLALGLGAIAAVVLPYVFDVRRELADDVVDWLGERASWAAQWLGEDAQSRLDTEPGKYIVSAAALVLAACVLYGLGAWLWSLAAQRRARRLLQPSRPPGKEPLGETTPLIRRFAYDRVAKHAEKIDGTYGWPQHPRRLRWLMPRLRGEYVLFGLRHRLRQNNLYDTAAPDPPRRVKFTPRATVRTSDGRGTDLGDPGMGAAGSHFGRNAPAFPPRGDLPSAKRISEDLLARRDGRFLAAKSLNLLAAAWVQFEVHDWMQHRQSEPPHVPGWPRARKMPPLVQSDAARTGAPRFVSDQTHWWDASQLYGVDPEFTESLRAADGRVKTGKGLLKAIEASMNRTPAAVPNLWLGLALFHELFAREHNAICDVLEESEPHLKGDARFNTARLVNAALMAKIHTVEWTAAVTAHPTTAHSILATWWGVLGRRTRRYIGRIGTGEVLSGIPGSRTRHDGVRYSLTEEFVAVYRMHPLIPDEVTFRTVTGRGRRATIPFGDLAVGAGPPSRLRKRLEKLERSGVSVTDAFYSLAVESPGRITLHNYPAFLRDLPLRDGGYVDLAARDIERMREAALPRYNDFRRLFHLVPKDSFVDLTGGRRKLAREIEAVYGDLEAVDLMVGLFAEPPPEGLAFSDTAFRVFLLMAARRLRSDRFFTSDFTPALYTRTGYRWVQTRTMKQMLGQHFPTLLPALDGVENVFKPWHEVS